MRREADSSRRHSFTRRRVRSVAVAVCAAAALSASGGLSAYASQPSPNPDEVKMHLGKADTSTSAGPIIDDAQAAIDALVLPPVPSEMFATANDIRAMYLDDPRFSDVEISRDRTVLKVWWDGDVPGELKDVVSSANIRVEVADTLLSPGHLREAVRAALSDSSLGIVAAAPKLDGSGIEVIVDDRDSAQLRSQDSAETILGVPVEVLDESSPAPLRRQNDYWGLGGARLYQWGGSGITNGCTTGFAVQKGTTVGVMFAAHCGAVGAQYVRWPDNAGTTVYPYAGNGVISAVSGAHDAAIMTTNTHMGAVYTHAWDNTNAYAIAVKGVQEPVPGAEICYSGSYSGFICGNVVDSNGWSYTLSVAGSSNTVNVTTAAKTVNATGTPAAGQGDSGGPGAIPTMVNGSAALLASTIISAGPSNSQSGCVGVQNRLCSPTVYSTSVNGALVYTGWGIKVG